MSYEADSMNTPVLARPIPSFRALLLLAWPIVISRSSQVIVGVTDAVLVADLGEASVAATPPAR